MVRCGDGEWGSEARLGVVGGEDPREGVMQSRKRQLLGGRVCSVCVDLLCVSDPESCRSLRSSQVGDL